VESLPGTRALLLVNYRPEYQHGWGGKTFYAQLRIDPLPPESADELAAALLGSDASLRPLKDLLIERPPAFRHFRNSLSGAGPSKPRRAPGRLRP
jgi:hypothetical protein